MGRVPHKKRRRRAGAAVEQLFVELLVGFVLDVLAGVFHVFTEPMGCVTAGENNLAYDCNQNTESHSFYSLHFLPFLQL